MVSQSLPGQVLAERRADKFVDASIPKRNREQCAEILSWEAKWVSNDYGRVQCPKQNNTANKPH